MSPEKALVWVERAVAQWLFGWSGGEDLLVCG